MSETSKSGIPQEQVISGLVRRQNTPRFLRECATQEDIDFLNYGHSLYPRADGSQTSEMLDQEIREVERLTGKRVGLTAGALRRAQEAVARTHLSGREQG